MSSTSIVPASLSENMKGFWKRPEGKVGAVVLLALAGTAVFAGWAYIVPFVLATVASTFWSAVYLVGIIAILSMIASHRFRTNISLIFKLLMRAMTSLVITIDPIGVIRERLVEMKKKRDEMNAQIANVRGAIETLQTTIEKNKQVADENIRLAEVARKNANSGDDEYKMRMNLQVRLKANQAQRLQQSNQSYSQLLVKIKTLYTLLTKWSTNVDYFIQDKEDEIKQAETQYRTVNATSKAFRAAMSVFRGNADDQEIYDTAMEYMVDQANMKLGEIADFQRVTQNFMDTIDLKNGVVDDNAMRALDAYEQKMLGPAQPDDVLVSTGTSPEPVVVKKKDSDYY